jgi:glutamate dehydrogenase
LIGSLCVRVRKRLPDARVAPCESFIRQFYHWVPPDDLADRTPADLYGAAISQWNLAQERTRGAAKVRVYNPDLERDGWQSPHTVIEIVSDDMPFIVDSVTMELGRQGYGIDLVIHPVVRVQRDPDGRLLDVIEPDATAADAIGESVLHAEVLREHDPEKLARLTDSLERVLAEVRAAVEDWVPMREQTELLIEDLEPPPPPAAKDVDEVKSFLRWVASDHFTFLGYREYDLVVDGDGVGLQVVPGSGLGILRGAPESPFKRLGSKALALAMAQHILVLTKANTRSNVHRPVYLDYIGVKKFGPAGEVVGERRFLGLYTSAAYKHSPREIPLIRHKVERVLKRAGFPPASHDRKALLEIIESYPRDSLFQMDSDELFEVAMGILGLGERQRVRLFVRHDQLDRFVECLVTIPRDRFNTENRERVGRILLEAFGGNHLDWTLQRSESLLVRALYIVHCPQGTPSDYDLGEIESRLARETRAWTDDLRSALIEAHGEDQGVKLHRRYERAFPPAYRADWPARSAIADVADVERLTAGSGPIMSLYRPLSGQVGTLRSKLFSSGRVSLSDVLPTFEHMGATVVDERPYEISPAGETKAWIYDFGLRCVAEDVERVGDLFQDAFLAARRGELEDDGLNGLVLRASLTGREVTIIRAVAKYLRQAGIAFSDAYMERTLLGHPEIATLLVKLFCARFDPQRHDREAERLTREIEEAVDAVASLDEDRILRSFLSVVCAILRTNYFRVGSGEDDPVGDPATHRPYLSFKLDPSKIAALPAPRPRFEIFVYSPRFEGVHLRGGKVARGGLRWSDRREDFRTEILGLMKAQMVKNALIVPVGSKGGFVLKRPPADGGREALAQEAIACYRMFLSGLLDLTDNIVGGNVVAPDRVVRYDDDDPYLVVAADKGTATFSDIANEVSAAYGFWLGDAFASGGSQGYDHKQMGITAGGAWESVKRHFRALERDIQQTDFTVAGIGDMSGDVFGNGMLLSRHIKLVAAFNHMHVFLDPDRDAERSFAERKRLFELPRSSWTDYDESLISEGGGVYPRTAKSIEISPQVREVLAIEDSELAPNELIRAILRAPVDLMWNGGIGTYVKASSESHADAGDKANDGLRVDGRELRCRVVGEGGNLGFTQRGRIEYALGGGRINTDAIDNVAGVNCSDHEVNIKILLGSLIAEGEMTRAQRNELLAEMTEAVGDQVLYGSYLQTQAMSIGLAQAPSMIDVHARLIHQLVQVTGLNRELEFLPDEETISERKAAHQGLVAPELAVVMAYCKIFLYAQLLESDLPEDPYLAHDLERYFPPPLGPGPARHPASPDRAPPKSSGSDRYSAQMRSHRLSREIIATVVANQLVDRAGTTFVFRLREETGAPPSILARAYAVAREVFDMRAFWIAVEALDNEVDADVQLEMLIEARRLVERATRWMVRANPRSIDIEAATRRFEPGVKLLEGALPDVLDDNDREAFTARAAQLESAGVPAGLAARVAGMPSMISVFDIVEVAAATRRDRATVMSVYSQLGSRLELNWLRDRIIQLPRANRWQALARAALREDLSSVHRMLTREVLESAGSDAGAEAAIEAWSQRNAAAVARHIAMLSDINASRVYDTTTLPVALREARNLLRAGDGDADGVGPTHAVAMAEAE